MTFSQFMFSPDGVQIKRPRIQHKSNKFGENVAKILHICEEKYV